MKESLVIASLKASGDQFLEEVRRNDVLMNDLVKLHYWLNNHFDGMDAPPHDVKEVSLTNLEIGMLGICLGGVMVEGYAARNEKGKQ